MNPLSAATTNTPFIELLLIGVSVAYVVLRGSTAVKEEKEKQNKAESTVNGSNAISNEASTVPKVPKIINSRVICVFCGSKAGTLPDFAENARRLGEYFAKSKITLIYGGGSIGLMGEVARSCDKAGGQVIGIIPKALSPREITGEAVQPENLVVVSSMHERKALMASLSNAFLALPGGFGTYEESLEAITWTQLGIQSKPVGFLNIKGYFDHLEKFFESTLNYGFIVKDHTRIYKFESDVESLVQHLLSIHPDEIDRNRKGFQDGVTKKLDWDAKTSV